MEPVKERLIKVAVFLRIRGLVLPAKRWKRYFGSGEEQLCMVSCLSILQKEGVAFLRVVYKHSLRLEICIISVLWRGDWSLRCHGRVHSHGADTHTGKTQALIGTHTGQALIGGG